MSVYAGVFEPTSSLFLTFLSPDGITFAARAAGFEARDFYIYSIDL